MNKKQMIRLLPAVVLALLLVGDGVFYAMTSPSRMFSAPPSFGSGENPFGAEANADSSAAEGETVKKPRPDFAGSDSSDFPAFDAAEGGTPPGFSGTEGGTPPDFGGTEDGTPPDFGGNGTGAPASINTGAFRLMRWRFLCLPVGALLLIAEVVCILRLRRKKDSSGETITTEELDPAERRMRSERRTRRIGMGVLCGMSGGCLTDSTDRTAPEAHTPEGVVSVWRLRKRWRKPTAAAFPPSARRGKP